MRMIKKVLLLFFVLTLCACQSRMGKIEVLNNLKVSEISGIHVRVNDSHINECYLTENDETIVIKLLKGIKTNDLKPLDGIKDFEYCLNVETVNESHELLLFSPNMICINGLWFNIDEKVFSSLLNVLKSITYFDKTY